MKKKAEAEKENAERWMLTYLDMITLLFVTFVVLYAMSVVDKGKFEALAESLSAAMGSPAESTHGPGTGPGKMVDAKAAPLTAVPIQSKKARSPLYDKAYDILKSSVQEKRLAVRQEERGLVIEMGAQVFFETGSAELPEGAMSSFLPVAQMLASLPNAIQIEGYADDLAKGVTSKYTSNWDLSVQRSITVLGVLQDLGINPSRMSVVGYGSSYPLVSNETPEGRAYNRQVNIVIPYMASDK
jgi:chemotaxis protein MotB